jgi:hypothetical protein
MVAATLTNFLVPPLALDGESITGNQVSIAVVSVVSIAGGYLLLAALWYFVFRDKAQKKSETHLPTESDESPVMGTQATVQEDVQPPSHIPSVSRPVTIQRRTGSRFRRR